MAKSPLFYIYGPELYSNETVAPFKRNSINADVLVSTWATKRKYGERASSHASSACSMDSRLSENFGFCLNPRTNKTLASPPSMKMRTISVSVRNNQEMVPLSFDYGLKFGSQASSNDITTQEASKKLFRRVKRESIETFGRSLGRHRITRTAYERLGGVLQSKGNNTEGTPGHGTWRVDGTVFQLRLHLS